MFKKFSSIILNFVKNKFLIKLKSFSINTNQNLFLLFKRFIIVISLILILICTSYLFLMGKEEILVNGTLTSTLKYSLLFIIYFLISIFIILKILDFKMNSYKFKLFTFITLNILIGTILIGEMQVYNSPQILIEKYNFKEEYILILKDFIKNYVW